MARVQPVTEAYVVLAPPAPTTTWRFGVAILGDIALCLGLIYGIAVIPGLAIKWTTAAASLVLSVF